MKYCPKIFIRFFFIVFTITTNTSLSQIHIPTKLQPGKIFPSQNSVVSLNPIHINQNNGENIISLTGLEKEYSFGSRFLYSQKILWPSSIAGHIGLYVISADIVDWGKQFRLQTVKESFTKAPIIEHDPWIYNYLVHPVMGSYSYLAYRNRGAGFWESFLGSAINSTIYEYIIASSTQRPSVIDLTVTPIGGSILGEGIFQLKKKFTRDNYLSLIEKIIITIIDPFEVLHVKFKFHKLIK